MRLFAQARGTIFPIYRDPEGKVTKHFGARFAPEVYLLDRQGTLVFQGGLQDDAARSKVRRGHRQRARQAADRNAQHAHRRNSARQAGASPRIDNPYGSIWFASEQVFETIPLAPVHHCSTICQAANGDLLCLWYGGSYESADDQAIFLARKRPDDKRWSTPVALFAKRDRSARQWA